MTDSEWAMVEDNGASTLEERPYQVCPRCSEYNFRRIIEVTQDHRDTDDEWYSTGEEPGAKYSVGMRCANCKHTEMDYDFTLWGSNIRERARGDHDD